MRLSVGMDAIGLEPTLRIGHVGNAFEEEGYQTRFVLLPQPGATPMRAWVSAKRAL